MESATPGTYRSRRPKDMSRDADSAVSLASATIESPIGLLLVRTSVRGVVAIDFNAKARYSTAVGDDATRLVLDQAIRELREYFAGTRREFEVSVDAVGTPFRQRVWQELREIPFGTTISYGELARRVGNMNASRAVGAANGANPVPIIIPCHRVIGADGTLTGFGGGVWRKDWLLRHEGVLDELWDSPHPIRGSS